MRKIPRHPDYSISKNGDVWSEKSRRFLSQKITKDGYAIVALYTNGRREDIGVHRLVMWTYVGPQYTHIEVRHKNAIRNDNRLENLEYGTRSDNAKDRVKHGNNCQTRRTLNGRSKLSEIDVLTIKNRLDDGDSPKDIAADFGVVKGTIYHIRNQNTWIGP